MKNYCICLSDRSSYLESKEVFSLRGRNKQWTYLGKMVKQNPTMNKV